MNTTFFKSALAVSLAVGLTFSVSFADTTTDTSVSPSLNPPPATAPGDVNAAPSNTAQPTSMNPAVNDVTNETPTGAPVASTPTPINGDTSTPSAADVNTLPQPETNTLPSTNSTTSTTTSTTTTTPINNAPAIAPTTNTMGTSSTSTTAVIPNDQILTFSEKVALAAFSYSYKNYQQDLTSMQPYFTQSGWTSFNKALSASNNLDVVQKEKLNVSAKVVGQAAITDQQNTATGQTWQVSVPVLVTYQNEKNQKVEQDLTVKLLITTVNTSDNPTGFGVQQFIAMPNANAQKNVEQSLDQKDQSPE